MAKQVFISHAGADSAQALAVSDVLTHSGVEVRLDREALRLGDSFLSFMNSALADSDYCLLLWSRNAAETPWVRMEWESALYRSVKEKRAFLLTGRLEDAALPPLLTPRLGVDLFPELQPGVGRIVETWQADRSAEVATERPVAPAPIDQQNDAEPDTVYVTSEAFGITVPVRADLHAPAGLLLDRLISRAGLPQLWQFDGRIGVRFTYTLMHGEQMLERGKTFAAQNVAERSVLWLKTRMSQFSDATPMDGSILDVTLRHGIGLHTGKSDPIVRANEKYLTAIRNAHLRR